MSLDAFLAGFAPPATVSVRRPGFDEDAWAPLADPARPGPPLPPGTLVRAAHGGEARLGVVSRDGDLSEAPPLLPHAPKGVDGWLGAWEGPLAEADWMLSCYAGLDRALVVRAACACARASLGYVPPWDAVSARAVATAEAWSRGEASLSHVLDAAAAVADVNSLGPTIFRAALAAVYAACRCAGDDRPGSAAPQQAALGAARALALRTRTERSRDFPEACEAHRRDLAPLVRAHLPLGAVLLALA